MRAQPHGTTSVRTIVSAAHPTVRGALTAFLSSVGGVAVVGGAAGNDETMALVERMHPDAVVVDFDDALHDGWCGVRKIKQRAPETRVLVVALDPASEPVAMAAGADVFLLKGGPPSQLTHALTTREVLP